ncbi:MAG: hypothetical protein ACD_24C00527G0002 [uncultured bacterium]|nr:MAG: hypothetical protein ACD_24C00527G0002 [uncultured bacterium]
MVYKHTKSLLFVLIAVSLVVLFFFHRIGSILLVGTTLFYFIWYKTNQLELTQNAVVIKSGILMKTTREIPYTKINSVQINRYGSDGDIEIDCANFTTPVKFTWVSSPDRIKDQIYKRMKM